MSEHQSSDSPLRRVRKTAFKRTAITLDTIALAFLLYAFFVTSSPYLLIPLIWVAAAIASMASVQKLYLVKAALGFCIVVGSISTFGVFAIAVSDDWEPLTLKLIIVAILLMFGVIAPLLSAYVMNRMYSLTRN